MKKILPIIVVLIIIVGVFVFLKKSDDVDESESSGMLGEDTTSIEFVISDSALPEGVERSAISASRIPNSDFTDAETGLVGDVLFAYDLQPEGTIFSEPIRVRMSMPAPTTSQLLLVNHSSEQGSEFLEDVIFDVDPNTGLATIDVGITHFSKLVVVADTSFKITATGGGEYFVGDTVAYKLTVQPSGKTIRYTDPYYYSTADQEYKKGTSYTIGKSKLSTSWDSEVLMPDKKESPEKTLKQSEVYEHEDTFSCKEVGEDYIWAGPISIQYTMTGERRNNAGEFVYLDEKVQAWGGVIAKYKCKATVDPAGDSSLQLDPTGLQCPGAQLLSKDQGGVSTDVVKLKDGECYEASQFSFASNVDECAEVHYHTTLTSLTGKVRPDSDPCGAAVDSDITEHGTIWIAK